MNIIFIQTQSTWGHKKKDEEKKTDIIDNQTKLNYNEKEDTQEKLLEISRKMLESKSRYYEEVIGGKKAIGSIVFIQFA